MGGAWDNDGIMGTIPSPGASATVARGASLSSLHAGNDESVLMEQRANGLAKDAQQGRGTFVRHADVGWDPE